MLGEGESESVIMTISLECCNLNPEKLLFCYLGEKGCISAVQTAQF